MNELKEIVVEYKKLCNKIDDYESVIKKQKERKNLYEEKIIHIMKKNNIKDKPIQLTDTKLVYKLEERQSAFSQKYLQENINNFCNRRLHNILGSKSEQVSKELYDYLVNNRPKKTYEKLHEKKSKIKL